MKISLEAGMAVYLADTYNNPADQRRETIIIRKRDKEICVKSEILAK